MSEEEAFMFLDLPGTIDDIINAEVNEYVEIACVSRGFGEDEIKEILDIATIREEIKNTIKKEFSKIENKKFLYYINKNKKIEKRFN